MTQTTGPANETARERADREATDWAILLQEDANDPGLRQRFAAWRAASADNAAAWEETRGVLRLIDQLPPSNPAGDTTGHSVHRHRRKHRRWIAAALAACLALAAAPGLLLDIRADHRTGTGQVETVRMADGSTIQLAPRSAIAMNDESDGRGVRLIRGQAYFEVTPDPSRSFQVRAGDSKISVLGTAFEVTLQSGAASVAVSHGRVQVSFPRGTEYLEAGQTLHLPDKASPARGHRRPGDISAWVDGRLIVNDQPISAVIDALRPWHNGIIVASGPGLDRHRVTGIYDLSHPDTALEALAHSHPVRLRRLSSWATHIDVR